MKKNSVLVRFVPVPKFTSKGINFSVGSRGVTRLDGVRGKKNVWRSLVQIWGLPKASALFWRKYLWHCCDFRRPRSHSTPGELRPLAPSLRLWSFNNFV